MVAIPLPLSTAPGRTPQESAGRLINCYAEPLGQDVFGAKGFTHPTVVWRRSPGLTAWGTMAAGVGCRGFLEVNGTLFTAVAARLYYGTSVGGVQTLVGTLSGTKKAYFSRDNAATPNLFAVTENGAFTFTTAGISSYAPAGFKVPNSVTFLDGFTIFTAGDGTLQATGLNATTFNTLDVTKAEAKPDGLTRGITFGSQFFAFGPKSTEVYTNTANPVGFPLSRSFVMPRGLINGAAVAGQEDGFGSALIWVADDSTVVRFTGSGTEKISPPDLDRLIQAAALANSEQLEASVYISDGHAKWVLSSNTWTWEFDLNTQKWNERKSYLQERWQASQSINAFGKWLVGQKTGGAILSINSANYREGTQPLVFRLESGAVQKFPNMTRVGAAYFNLSAGTGIASGVAPIETEPVASISWSNDGGVTWSNPVLRKIGAQGLARTLMTLNRTGMTGRQGRRWRIEVSDPVYFGLMGGDQEISARAA